MAAKAPRPVILCVDDEKMILDSLRDQINAVLGGQFDIEAAQDSDEALELISELQAANRPVAIVISDQMMPGMPGDKLLAEVGRRVPLVRTVLLTGNADLQSVVDAFNTAGLFRYMPKPWEEAELQEVLDSSVASYRLQHSVVDGLPEPPILALLANAAKALRRAPNLKSLFERAVTEAVRCTEAELSVLIAGPADALRVESFYADDPDVLQPLLSAQRENPDQLSQQWLAKIEAAADTLGPLLGVAFEAGHRLGGFLVLENPTSQQALGKLQFQGLKVLAAQVGALAELASARQQPEPQPEPSPETELAALAMPAELEASLQFARYIQKSLLPSEAGLAEVFPDSFLLHAPADTVSGDFYWWVHRGTDFFVAAVECAGQGLPSALLAVIANNTLNRAARNPYLQTTAQMLGFVQAELQAALRIAAKGTQNPSGIDVALVRYDTRIGEIEFSGANRTLLVVRDGELVELGTHDPPKPTQKGRGPKFAEGLKIKLGPTDTVYLATDGFQVQVGGQANGNLFANLIMGAQHLNMSEQRAHLELALHTWKSANIQTDDVLVIGFRYRE